MQPDEYGVAGFFEYRGEEWPFLGVVAVADDPRAVDGAEVTGVVAEQNSFPEHERELLQQAHGWNPDYYTKDVYGRMRDTGNGALELATYNDLQDIEGGTSIHWKLRGQGSSDVTGVYHGGWRTAEGSVHVSPESVFQAAEIDAGELGDDIRCEIVEQAPPAGRVVDLLEEEGPEAYATSL